MAFLKFSVADNASWNLNAGISASATTITLKTWEGASFPSSNFIITLVQYTTPSDPTTPVALREKVLIQSRSGDILTVASGWRGYDWDTWTAFDADDYVYLNVTSKVIEDMQDEITRLETDKLDDGALRASMWNWKTFYTNWSWAETELTNGTSGYFLQSNWPTAAPSWWPGSVDINWHVANDGDVTTADQLLFYSSTGGWNRKRDAKATTSVMGLVKMATAWDITTGTDEEKYINPKQWKDSYTYWQTMNTYSASSSWSTAYTASKQVTWPWFSCLTIYWQTWNSPSSVSAWIQTSPDNSVWTTKVSQTFTKSNSSWYSSVSLMIPEWQYVRWYAWWNSDDDTSVTLNVQDNS